jgi:riboflavin kinase/FMN adenylyltransferase
LNLKTDAQILPAAGVYITRTRDAGSDREWQSVTNAGYRPTFGSDDGLTIETYLLEGLDGDTPDHIVVEFLKRLRDERKFENPEALKAQILRDVRRAQTWFRRVPSARRSILKSDS